ncbi:MAG: helix-turn-helix domain-containing protein [Actinomycetota bacterium]
MSDTQGDGGWERVEDAAEIADVRLMEDLDLIPDITHPIRGPLMRRLRNPRSVAELAEAMKVPVTRLYHHVNRLEELGIIQVVATRRSGATTERRYQTVARSWKIEPTSARDLDPYDLAQAFGSIFDLAKIGLQREIEAGRLPPDEGDDGRIELTSSEVWLTDTELRTFVERMGALMQEMVGISDEDRPDAQPVNVFTAIYPEGS